jgi:hypothetical protein
MAEEFPPEIFDLILQYVDPGDLPACNAVCKLWRELLKYRQTVSNRVSEVIRLWKAHDAVVVVSVDTPKRLNDRLEEVRNTVNAFFDMRWKRFGRKHIQVKLSPEELDQWGVYLAGVYGFTYEVAVQNRGERCYNTQLMWRRRVRRQNVRQTERTQLQNVEPRAPRPPDKRTPAGVAAGGRVCAAPLAIDAGP